MDGISALMDGELDEHPARHEIARLKNDPELRDRWDTFHLVGDALRGEPMMSAGFSAAFAQRLAAEPTVLAPRRASRQAKRVTTYALSAAASVSAAALVAWVAMSGPNADSMLAGRGTDARLESAGSTSGASAIPASVSIDGTMNEYFLAHQGFSPSTAIQGLAPYIRTVSATRPAEQGR
ncbi:MAG: Anti-sigma-E factor RseA [Betaproteobacteria bacterium]|nr:Anti-sigma-E factor RseA [Betaproteobacteria bacterium]